MSSETKMPLQKYLKVLTGNGVPVKKAMQISGKLYKTVNTPAQLSALTDLDLVGLGFEKEDRKFVMAALKKGGYFSARPGPNSTITPSESSGSNSTQALSPAVTVATTPTKKRKRIEDVNDFLPGPTDEAARYGSMDFNEVLDPEKLMLKTSVVNRAPIMTAWSMIVAERQGFKREEALSIASAYTEMNALAKGVSLGIYKDGKQKGIEAARGGTQPYVELMGRRIPLYQAQTDQWRALVNGTPAQPSVAFSYISRALRQTTPYIIGAMRLLAESFNPDELNQKGFALYTEFRPEVSGWGERAQVRCDSILSLRKTTDARDTVKLEETQSSSQGETVRLDETQSSSQGETVKLEETQSSPHHDSQEPPDKIRKLIVQSEDKQTAGNHTLKPPSAA